MLPLESAKIHQCCSNVDNPNYVKQVLIRKFKAGLDTVSVWKICSDHKDDPLYKGSIGQKCTLIEEKVYRN